MSASARSRSSGRVLDNPREVSYENDPRYQPDGVRAVSAYAPVDRQGPSEILAGRGLY
jgi:rare lipoprotein A